MTVEKDESPTIFLSGDIFKIRSEDLLKSKKVRLQYEAMKRLRKKGVFKLKRRK